MTSNANIVLAQFAGLGLGETAGVQHMMRINFPAGELIEDQMPFLETPTDIENRTKPTADHSIGDIPVQLPQAIPIPSTFHRGSQAYKFLDTLATLSTLPGSSHLRFVAFGSEEDVDIYYRLVLFTRFTTGSTNTAKLLLSWAQMQELLTLANSHLVVAVLKDLIGRESDVSYFHVYDNLVGQYGTDYADQEDSQWDGMWNLANAPDVQAVDDMMQGMEIDPSLQDMTAGLGGIGLGQTQQETQEEEGEEDEVL